MDLGWMNDDLSSARRKRRPRSFENKREFLGDIVSPFTDPIFGGDGLFGGIFGYGAAAQGAQANANALLQAQRENSRANDRNNAFGLARLYSSVYGDGWQDQLRGVISNEQMEDLQSAMDQQGGGASRGGGLVQGYENLAQQARQGGDANIRLADNIARQYDTRDIANQFGRERQEQIREDADRDLKAQNRLSLGQLSGMGFGNSTAVANQANQNRAENQRSRDRALTDVSDQRTRLSMAATNQAAGLQNNALQTRLAMQGRDLQYSQLPLSLQERTAFQAANPGQFVAPNAGVSPYGAYQGALGQSQGALWGGLLGLGGSLGGAAILAG